MLSGGSESIDVVMSAFYDCLGHVQDVTKTQTADTGKYTYTYVGLGDVLDEVKRACRMAKLEVSQNHTVVDGYMAVHTMLLHVGGQWVTFLPFMQKLGNDPQAVGSALTYARRYALLTLFGIAPEDDDGKAATVSAQTQPGRRTEAERLIREGIGQMTPDERKAFTDAFKAQFSTTLTDLPASRHGDALTWSRAWMSQETAGAEIDERTADQVADDYASVPD